jgi:hypothetical protein
MAGAASTPALKLLVALPSGRGDPLLAEHLRAWVPEPAWSSRGAYSAAVATSREADSADDPGSSDSQAHGFEPADSRSSDSQVDDSVDSRSSDYLADDSVPGDRSFGSAPNDCRLADTRFGGFHFRGSAQGVRSSGWQLACH